VTRTRRKWRRERINAFEACWNDEYQEKWQTQMWLIDPSTHSLKFYNKSTFTPQTCFDLIIFLIR
jgi:hypothetical protein